MRWLVAPLSLPNSITRLPQGNAELDFHVSGALVGHGVVHLVQPGQQAQAKVSGVSAGLDAGFVFVKALVYVQAGHADINQRFAQHVVRVAAPEAGDVPNFGRQLNDVDAVVVAALLDWWRMGLLLGFGCFFRHGCGSHKRYTNNSCLRPYSLGYRPI